MNIIVIIGIIIAIVGLMAIIFIIQYNKFLWSNILINKGETSITNALVKKYNILIRYFDFLKEKKIDVKEDEYDKYKMLNLKQPLNKLNNNINEMNNLINHYMDNNEKLLKNETIINLNKEINEINITINGGKKYYNDNLVLYNHLCNAFPSIIIAKLKHYKEKEFLDDEIKEELKILEE